MGIRSTLPALTCAAILAMTLSAAAVAGDAADAADADGGNAVAAVHTSTEPYEVVLDNVRFAIVGKGLIVSDTLHIKDMMERTAADLGYPAGVFAHAESIEFCSALLSHEMVGAHPSNVTLCPFTIAVYVLAAEPETVYVAYRRPVLAGAEAGDAQARVEGFLDDIVQEALF